MPYDTPQPTIHNTRYVEYTDVFADKNIIPSAAVRENLLLFDTFDGKNPLLQIFPNKEKHKMYQKLYIYIIRGEAVIEINGKPNTLNENMFISIMPENTTSLTSASHDLRYLMMVVYPRLSNQIYNEIGVTYTNTKLTLKHFISQLTPEQAQRVCSLYNDIKSDLLAPAYEEIAFCRPLSLRTSTSTNTIQCPCRVTAIHVNTMSIAVSSPCSTNISANVAPSATMLRRLASPANIYRMSAPVTVRKTLRHG